jgi:ATP-dependent exoDNAse (exonuclease V) alpha subunit
VAEVGIEQAIMIVRDNQTRAALNEQARAWRDAQAELAERVEVGGLEVAVGDRVIARRNDRALDVDNGTRGTVRAVDLDTRALTIEIDGGQVRELPAAYAAEHLEHAYALTGHGSQGATVERAVVVGRPEDFTNEWAYTALSRARDPVHVHLIAEPNDRSDRSEIAPNPPDRTAQEAMEAMRAAMGRRERENLALDQIVRARASTPAG